MITQEQQVAVARLLASATQILALTTNITLSPETGMTAQRIRSSLAEVECLINEVGSIIIS